MRARASAPGNTPNGTHAASSGPSLISWMSRWYRGRHIPSLLILETNVVRLSPSRAAAPRGPPIIPPAAHKLALLLPRFCIVLQRLLNRIDQVLIAERLCQKFHRADVGLSAVELSHARLRVGYGCPNRLLDFVRQRGCQLAHRVHAVDVCEIRL